MHDISRSRDGFSGDIKIETEIDRVDDHHLRAGQCGLTQAVVEDWLILARKTTDDQNRIKLLHACERDPETGVRRRGFLVTEVRLPQSMVDVVGPQSPHEFLCKVMFLGSGRRGNQGPDFPCPVPVDHVTQFTCRTLYCRIPIDFLPVVPVPDHGNRKTLTTVQTLIAETIAV